MRLLILIAVFCGAAAAQCTVRFDPILGKVTCTPTVFPGNIVIGSTLLGPSSASWAGMGFPALTVTPANSGGTSYAYTVVATDAYGKTRTVVSNAAGATPLNATNKITIAVAAWPGDPYLQPVGSCSVYRTFGGASLGKLSVSISNCAAGGSVDDTGLAGDASAPPYDTSGVVSQAGYPYRVRGEDLFIGWGTGPANPTASDLFGSVVVGANALGNVTTGSYNIGVGSNVFHALTTGSGNTAMGQDTMFSSNASSDAAFGVDALFRDLSGHDNSAVGKAAMYGWNCVTCNGYLNVGIGSGAGFSNDTGYQNTWGGANAGNLNTSGHDNTAWGLQALQTNATGNSNTAVGSFALNLTTSSFNTGVGYNALGNVAASGRNTAVGNNAAANVTTGSSQVVMGDQALFNTTTGSANVALGQNSCFTANATGSVCLGWAAGFRETGTAKLFIDNPWDGSGSVPTSRNTEAAARQNSMIYGIFDGTNGHTGQSLAVNADAHYMSGWLQLTAPGGTPTTLAQPACNAAAAGRIWYSGHTAGVKDSATICAADAADAYAWRTIY